MNKVTVTEKKCSKCNEIKLSCEFNKDRNRKTGLTNYCKLCLSNKNKIIYEANKEIILKRNKEYRDNNISKIKDIYKNYYNINKEDIRQHRENNKEEIRIKQKEYRDKNKVELSENKKQYYIENKNKFSEYGKIYRKENKEKIRFSKNKYQKHKREIDSLFKIRSNISGLIRYTIKRHGFKKKNKTEDILGCSFEEFKIHIESQWEDWMSWDNYGNPKDGIFEINKTWDIDHIIPSSSAINEGDLIKLNHFSNLQPLCSYKNRFIKVNN